MIAESNPLFATDCAYRVCSADAGNASEISAVFLDRDGVINENRADHVKSWDEFEFLPGAREAIARLTQAQVPIFVVSNQAIINRGMVSSAEVEAINAAMVREIEHAGGRVVAVAYCPHRPDEQCGCRKPRPGLLHRLASDFDIELRNALLVGDALSDIQAGEAAGCRTALVLTGRGRHQLTEVFSARIHDLRILRDLSDVCDLVLGPTVV